MEALYRISYYAGVQTVRLFHRMGRFFTLLFAPFRLLLRKIVTLFKRRRGKTLRQKCKTLVKNVAEAGRRVKVAWKRHPMLGIWQAVLVPFYAARRHWRVTRNVLVTAMIVLAGTALAYTFRYWNNITFALALTDADGHTFGYVSDESELQAGLLLAQERLETTDAVLTTTVKPDVSLQMIPQARVLNRYQICDYVLSRTDVPSISACGIYVDGAFQGAVNGRHTAERVLQKILEDSRDGQDDITVSFFETVELVDGRYPNERVVKADELFDYLTSEENAETFYDVTVDETLVQISEKTGVALSALHTLNPQLGEVVSAGQRVLIRCGEPRLQVLMTGNVQYEIDVPFTVKRVADASAYEGSERVSVSGETGRSRVTAAVTYLGGKQLYSTITATEVIKAPTTQIVSYGTKKATKMYKGGPYAVGRLIWPTPETRYVSQYYKEGTGDTRHGGIDVWSQDMEGEDIVAADGGTVIVARDPTGTSFWSYGKYIIIDHGGGYQTLYAHCSELYVKEGDIVKQGQRIAAVGNTGRSSSAHLHFEVRVNGRAVNPMKYY